ncbi:alpha-L-fucosidase [Puteibacter caeruleilacunae]|nr:alpha-L-fucosidase [Puteibacter caeruleilacunae]
MKLSTLLTGVVLMLTLFSCKQVDPPTACGPVPSERQLKWHDMEFYAFVHFNMNTFTGDEWGMGAEPAKTFNPAQLDCRQWAKVCKEAGMKGIILTAKHHDGFCLWPSKYTEYSVKNAAWKDGKGDVMRELADACKEYGLKFGVYLSPWDRNHADYGKPEYITYFRNQLRELLTNYGDVFEVWFDGANGGTGYYGGANERRSVDRKTYYDWPNTYKIVRELQPDAMLFSDAGPDCRWCGNEEGWINPTNWSTLRRDEVWPGWPHYKQLRSGHEDGTHWVPAEVDVSIRPGWYYHESEDHKVKTLPHLLDIYYNSVGRNGSFLLNFPVDKRGLIHERDVEQVMKLAKTLKADFAKDLVKNGDAEASNERGGSSKYAAELTLDGDKETYWATDDTVKEASLTISFDEPTEFNRFLVQEYIKLGQRIQEFTVEAMVDGKWQTIAEETTVGYKRILRLPTVKATKIRFNVVRSKACPLISNIEVFNAPRVMVEPTITRTKAGSVMVKAADSEVDIYYTTDGSTPTTSSSKFTGAFDQKTKATLKAVVVDPKTGKMSPVTTKFLDVSHDKWSVKGTSDNKAEAAIDDNPGSVWYVNKMPAELIVDLGETQDITGFTYLPDQARWGGGIIFNYEFFVSKDGKRWGAPVSKGEFSNIKNNPVWQEKKFKAVKGRYIKLRAKSIINDEKRAGFAEVGVLTK